MGNEIGLKVHIAELRFKKGVHWLIMISVSKAMVTTSKHTSFGLSKRRKAG